MEPTVSAAIPAVAAMGVVAGLVLLVRGLSGYRTTVRVADVSNSSISSLA